MDPFLTRGPRQQSKTEILFVSFKCSAGPETQYTCQPISKRQANSGPSHLKKGWLGVPSQSDAFCLFLVLYSLPYESLLWKETAHFMKC